MQTTCIRTFCLLDSHITSFRMALSAWQALYASAYLFTHCRSDKRVKYLNLYTNNSNVNRQTDRPKENCLHMRVNIVFFCFVLGLSGVGSATVSRQKLSGPRSLSRAFHVFSFSSSLSLPLLLSAFWLSAAFVISHIFCNFGCRTRFSH